MNFTREYLTANLDMFPELKALQGVPQPERWHPEGDALEHTLLVLDQQQARYPGDMYLNLAAICHDFGKALTPKDNWPKHYGHADLGIKPTRDFLNRENYHGELVNVINFLVKYHMHMHQVRVMNHKTYLKLYNEAFNMSDGNALWLLNKLAKLGICDHYGRGGVDPNERYMDPFVFISIMQSFDINGIQFLNQMNQLKTAKDILERYKNVE